MGAPKQKWTSEEEDALKAGVVKHGAGKWRTILKDPEFSGILCLRSNVDLKDKWRNMSVIANGWGSRDRGKVVLKKSLPVTRRENHSALGMVSEDFDGEIVDAKPLATSDEFVRNPGPSRSSPRMESLILECILSLNEPHGSDKTTIAMFIEDQYRSPPNFKEMLSNNLKMMTAAGKLVKVKGAYRIAPSSDFSDYKGLRTAASDGKRKELNGADRIDAGPFKKMQVDAGLTKTRIMNSQEADAAAARAVAEAEIAMAEAEEAAREAEAAEAEAEEKQAFAEAAIMTLRNRNAGNMVGLA